VIVFGRSDIGGTSSPNCPNRATGYRQPALSAQVRIRAARPDDVQLIFGWIVELAEYERSPEQVRGTPELLEEALFGAEPSAEAVIAETRDGDAGWEPTGFALFHLTFSTWECRPGIWLEDLYVPPAGRRAGVGGALISRLAEITMTRGYTRLQWAALDWNQLALDFYVRIGASRLDEWKIHRLDGDALARVAAGAGPGD
jgi:GNAT superfamily N-acetyltransferase